MDVLKLLPRELLVYQQTFSPSLSVLSLFTNSARDFLTKVSKKTQKEITSAYDLWTQLFYYSLINCPSASAYHAIKIRAGPAKILQAIANITFCIQVGDSVTVYN